jgi:pimeloyl-ACP methyl ester carboxylesterase
MPGFERDGLSFNYLDRGRGTPFVFQHGLGGDVSQPAGVFSPPPGVRLLSLDCRGHGETRPLGAEERLSFSAFADDVVALMDRLRVRRAVVGGISMGAGVALNLALRYPQRAAGLVLSRPAWLDRRAPLNLRAYPVISRLLREHGAARGRELFAETEEYQELEEYEPRAGTYLASTQFGRDGARENAAALQRLANDAPVRDLEGLRQIGVPSLVLVNRRDPTHPFGYGETLARWLPRAELVEAAPKAADPERHAREVQEAVRTFLARHFASRDAEGAQRSVWEKA